jgi:hypothetical protein
LAGIVISTGFGVAAQLKESSDDAGKALALAQRNDKTLHEIQRGLYPLDVTEIELDFELPCKEAVFTPFCREIIAKSKHTREVELFASDWKESPLPFPFPWLYEFNIFASQNGKEYAPQNLYDWGDFALLVDGTNKKGDKSLSAFAFGQNQDRVFLKIANTPLVRQNNGKFKSLLDLDGATIVIKGQTESDLLFSFEIKLKSGETVSSLDDPSSKLEKKSASTGEAFFVYHIKNTHTHNLAGPSAASTLDSRRY